MASVQDPKTASELRQEMWAAHNRFSDLTAELIRLKESEPGSARHLQVLDEHLLAKREVDRLQVIVEEATTHARQSPIVRVVRLLLLLVVIFSILYFVVYSYLLFRFYDFIFGAALK
jgi:hypothetical protein